MREASTDKLIPRPACGLGWPVLLTLFAIAAAWRLLHLRVAADAGLFEGLFLDSQYYANVAHAIRAGAADAKHPYLLSPLYPYVLALFTSTAGELAAGSVRIMQAIAGAISCALAADIACRVADRRVGILTGLIAAVYGPLLYFDSRILVAGLQGLFVTLALWCLVVRDMRPCSRLQPIALLGAGASLGLSAALRPTSLAVLAAVVAVLWLASHRELRRHARGLLLRTALLLGGAAVSIAPFAAHNLWVGGEAVLLSANGGINCWIGNHAGAAGVFQPPPHLDMVNDPMHRLAASRAAGRELSYRESSAHWRNRALGDIRADPLRWGGLMLRKLALMAHPQEIPQLGSSFAWHRRHAWTLWFPIDARHLLILALFSPLVLRAGRENPRRIVWPLLVCAAHAGTVALFFVTGRYRAPMIPALIGLAAVTIVGLWDLLREEYRRSFRVLATALVLGMTLVASYRLYGRGSALRLAHSFAGEERHAGMVLMKRGRYQEAVEAFRRSLADREASEARTNLAIALKNLGRFAEAAREYELALQADPHDGVAWYNYGNLRRRHLGDAEGALEAYRNAVRYRPLMGQAHLNPGLTLLDLNRPAKAVGPLTRAVELSSPGDDWTQMAKDAAALARKLAG